MTRTCGSCFACCIAIGVQQLNKKPGEKCPLLAEPRFRSDKGACSVYRGRPDECRKFECLYLTETMGFFADDERPDKLGAVPWVPPTEKLPVFGIPVIHFYMTSKDAPENARLQKVLDRFKANGVTAIVERP